MPYAYCDRYPGAVVVWPGISPVKPGCVAVINKQYTVKKNAAMRFFKN